MRNRILGCLLILIGLVLFYVGLRSYNGIPGDVVETVGTIVDTQSREDSLSYTGFSYHTIINYTDEKGNVYHHQSLTGYPNSQDHLIGAKIDILYEKDKPKNVVYNYENKSSYGYIYYLSGGAFLILIGGIFYYLR